MDHLTNETNKRTLTVSLKNTIYISCLLLLHVYGTKSSSFMYAALAIEVFLIVYCLIKGNLCSAFIFTAISLACSMEVSSFVYPNSMTRPLYSIFSIPALSIFPFYILTGLLFVLSYQKNRKYLYEYSKRTPIRRFLRALPLLFFTGLLTGLISILINDNNIAEYSWYGTAFFTTNLRILSLICFVASGAYLVIANPINKSNIETRFIELLFAFGIVGLVTVVFRWHGYYGAIEEIMLMPLASSLCPMLIVIPSFYKVRKPFLFYVVPIVYTISTLFYNSLMGSKFYMVPLLALLIAAITSMQKGKLKILIISIIVGLILLLNSGNIFSLVAGNSFGNWKLSQFINLFSLSSGGNGIAGLYNNMDASPRFRIDEFVNIALEYFRKPGYALFGKGNCGSIIHTWGTTNWQSTNGAFSDYQISSGIYINMHESINVIFLRHGIVGLLFFVRTMIDVIKRVFKSPWALGGLVWFLFYWGIYISWWIGAMMLVLSLCYVENET